MADRLLSHQPTLNPGPTSVPLQNLLAIEEKSGL